MGKATKAFEFDRRVGGGTQVRLFWLPERDELIVEQRFIQTGDVTYRATPRDKGMDVFHHPECYPAIVPDFELVASSVEIDGEVLKGEVDAIALDGTAPPVEKTDRPELSDADKVTPAPSAPEPSNLELE